MIQETVILQIDHNITVGARFPRPYNELLVQKPQRAEQVQRAAIAQLLAMGISREQVAETLGLSIEEVHEAAPE